MHPSKLRLAEEETDSPLEEVYALYEVENVQLSQHLLTNMVETANTLPFRRTADYLQRDVDHMSEEVEEIIVTLDSICLSLSPVKVPCKVDLKLKSIVIRNQEEQHNDRPKKSSYVRKHIVNLLKATLNFCR